MHERMVRLFNIYMGLKKVYQDDQGIWAKGQCLFKIFKKWRKKAIITSLDNTLEALQEQSGTIIEK